MYRYDNPDRNPMPLPQEYDCPKCGHPGPLMAKVLTHQTAALSPQKEPAILQSLPHSHIIEQIYCAHCDFSIDINIPRPMRQPSCGNCRASDECVTKGNPRYDITAYLCPDFHWSTQRIAHTAPARNPNAQDKGRDGKPSFP